MSDDASQSFYHQVEDPRYRYLKAFQCQRLRDTYADFIAQPQYAKACDFFFYRLYSTEDTHDRDEAFEKIYSTARRFLGGEVTHSMEQLIDLQHLTVRLDEEILAALQRRGAPVEFTTEAYEAAYGEGDYDARGKQIELLEYTMRLVYSISHRLGISLVLTGLRAASLIVGDTRMVDFLYEGYQAFVHIPDIEPLAGAMHTREWARLDRIFGR